MSSKQSPAGAGRGGGAGRRSSRQPRRTWGQRLKRVGVWVVSTGLVLALVLGGVFYFAYRNTEIPSANAAYEAQTTYVTYAGRGGRIGTFAEQNRQSVPLSDISQPMQDAVVAAEDRTFYTNVGIDPRGIIRAAFSNVRGNATQGASTITQQYVKLLYLNQERTLSRKAREAFLSLKVQQETSKPEILEGYLNTIYFGRGAYGVQAAARAFFGVSASELTVAQSALLASVLNSPTSLSPDEGEEARARLLGRYQYVIDGMVDLGNLDAAEASRVRGQLPKVVERRSDNAYGGQRGFMLTMVKAELQRLGFDETEIDQGGLRVETTFTKKAMEANRAGVADQRPEGLRGLHVASASVDVRTGGLLGFYAGQDYLDSQLNWARLGGSPGSTFKTFALAAGLEAGFSLRDTFDGNAPYTFDSGGEIGNQGEGNGTNFGSAISLLSATEDSVNTAFGDLTDSLPNGPQDVLDTAVDMGVPRDSPGLEPNNAIALGSATISPIAMANAYATVASGGVRRDAHTVARVTRVSDGSVLYEDPRERDRALPEDIAADVSYALQQVVTSGTGGNAALGDRPVAGKTGTATNDDGDVSSSWFVGFTPQVSTAVMYVRGRGNGALNGFLPTFYGGQYPALTFADIMGRVTEGTEVVDFPEPAFVDGTAPEEGHAPYTPPPAPEPEPEPEPPRDRPRQEEPTPEPPAETVAPPPTEAPLPTEPVDPGADQSPGGRGLVGDLLQPGGPPDGGRPGQGSSGASPQP